MTAYYSASGRFAPDAPFTALAAGVPAALVLSWIYAYAILYIPIVGWVTFILTGGLGIAVGAVVGLVLRARQVRSGALAWLLGGAVGLFTLWFSWVSWIVGLVRRADGEASWLGALLSPSELWETIVKVNEVGAWTLKGLTPTGTALWVLWALEAIIIVGAVAMMTHTMIDEPFCETCGHWCDERKGVASSADGDVPELAQQLERKNFGAVVALGPASDPAAFLRYDVHECASCGATNTLSVVRVVTTKDRHGKPEQKEDVVLRGLLVTRAEVGVVHALSVSAGAVAAAA